MVIVRFADALLHWVPSCAVNVTVRGFGEGLSLVFENATVRSAAWYAETLATPDRTSAPEETSKYPVMPPWFVKERTSCPRPYPSVNATVAPTRFALSESVTVTRG